MAVSGRASLEGGPEASTFSQSAFQFVLRLSQRSCYCTLYIGHVCTDVRTYRQVQLEARIGLVLGVRCSVLCGKKRGSVAVNHI